MERLLAVLFGIVAIYVAVIIRALLQRRDHNMRAPVLESFADCRCSDLVVQTSQRPNIHMVAIRRYYIFHDLLLSILLCYIVLYIVICNNCMSDEVALGMEWLSWEEKTIFHLVTNLSVLNLCVDVSLFVSPAIIYMIFV